MRASVNDILQRGDSMFAFPVAEANEPQAETEPQSESVPANADEHQAEDAELDTECDGQTAPNKPGQDSGPRLRSETSPGEAVAIQSQLDEMLQQEIREMSERP